MATVVDANPDSIRGEIALLREWIDTAGDVWSTPCEVLSKETVAAHWSSMEQKGRRRWMASLLRRKGELHIHQLIAIVLRVPQELLPGLQDISRILVNLRIVATEHLRVRPKLPSVDTLDQVLDLIRSSKNIMVLTGAGVSVSCGIPDFRSRNGIYKRLHVEYGMAQPEDMFDIEYFNFNPQPFFSFVKELFPGNFTPSPSHYFIRLLEEKGKLLRNYTQNIDTLESVAGISRVFQCHGSFNTATCRKCGHKVPGDSIRDDVFADRIPMCPLCAEASEEKARQQRKRKNHFDRDENEEEEDDDDPDDDAPLPVLKPDIVFFGQALSNEFDDLLTSDRDKVDLLIVMGSSLQVAPVSGIMSYLPTDVPQIIVNREPIKHMEFDVELLGNCDDIVGHICSKLGWKADLDRLAAAPVPPLTDEPTHVPPQRYLFNGALADGSEGEGDDQADQADQELEDEGDEDTGDQDE